MPRDGSDEVVADLWAMAAELERQFAGYKQRLAAWNSDSDAAAARDGDASGDAEPGGDDDSCDVRPGRMYEAYVRRRDERLRQGWRARMERKEAEVKALWVQLELAGRSGGRERAPPAGAAPTTAGDEEEWISEQREEEGSLPSVPVTVVLEEEPAIRLLMLKSALERQRSEKRAAVFRCGDGGDGESRRHIASFEIGLGFVCR